LTNRHVQPYRVVFTDRQWYCVAFDLARDDWRTFRVDRMDWVRSSGTRFVPIEDPPDAAELVARGIAVAGYPETAVIRVLAPFEETSRVVPRTVAVLEAGENGTTIARIGGDADWIAAYVASLPCRVEVLEPDEVRAELRALALRLAADHPA